MDVFKVTKVLFCKINQSVKKIGRSFRSSLCLDNQHTCKFILRMKDGPHPKQAIIVQTGCGWHWILGEGSGGSEELGLAFHTSTSAEG